MSFELSKRTLAVFFIIFLGAGWHSSSFAKKPRVDTLYNAAAIDADEDGIFSLEFEGREKLKLSKCCKIKQPITIEISIPESGKWQVDAVNGEPVGTIDDTVDPPVHAIEPILGVYRQRNKVWFDLKFNNSAEEDKFTAIIEALASAEAGEPVFLAYNKYKLRIKVKERRNKYILKFLTDFKLRRALDESRVGQANNGSGVYKDNTSVEIVKE